METSAKQTNGHAPHIEPKKRDFIQKITGGFGKYQLILCLVILASKFSVAFHQMAIIFLAPKTEYSCPGSNNTCPCDNPEYDRSVFSRTIVMQWHLICGRAWMTSMTQTMFQLGVLLGSVWFGMASDRYGRKKPLLLSVILQLGSGISASFITEFWSFSFMRLLTGISVGGVMVTGFVIIMEFVGKQHREIISALYQIPFNIGYILLSVFGYYFRYYSQFQLAVSIPTIFLLSYFFLVPESPRWLIAVKRPEEAIKILDRVAIANKRPTENIRADVEAYELTIEKAVTHKGNIVDLFRTPNMRKNIIAMAFNWMTSSYCFYGLSQYVGQLSGNIFYNVSANATVMLIGCVLSIPLMRVVGRRTILIVLNLVSAVCLFTLCFISDHIGRVLLASIGSVSSYVVFLVVYLYCTEMFPTVVRNAALGFSSMMARFGAMVAPFILSLDTVAVWLPPLCFAVLPLMACIISLALPETKGCDLMTTIEEGENFGKKSFKDIISLKRISKSLP